MPPGMPPYYPGCGGIKFDYLGHSIDKKTSIYAGFWIISDELRLEDGGA